MTAGRLPPRSHELTPASAPAGAGRVLGGRIPWIMALGGALLALAPWVEPARASGHGLDGTATTGDALSELTPLEHREGAPPGYTGGFGEGNCTGCHFDAAVNTPPGDISVKGVPTRYTAGTTYPITITLTRPSMKIGGFQITARLEQGGAQAGTWAIAPADAARMKVTTDRGVQYATHTRDGTALAAPDTAR